MRRCTLCPQSPWISQANDFFFQPESENYPWDRYDLDFSGSLSLGVEGTRGTCGEKKERNKTPRIILPTTQQPVSLTSAFGGPMCLFLRKMPFMVVLKMSMFITACTNLSWLNTGDSFMIFPVKCPKTIEINGLKY